MNCIIVKDRIPFNSEQVQTYIKEYNIFNNQKPGIDLDTFKKTFFPHLYLVQDPIDDQEDLEARQVRDAQKLSPSEQKKVVEGRLLKLEAKLKQKFSNCYHHVRKAFLDLDGDYDGYITVEDILKYFGNDPDLNYNDLIKLMIDHDEQKQGKINYSDFSKWFGSAIHCSSGFYFRHDSSKNPNYDMQLQKQERNKGNDKYEAAQALLVGDMEEKILEKIKL